MQVEDTNNDDRITGQKFETGSRDAAAGNIMMIEQVANVSPHENNSITDNELHNNTYSARKSEDGENECRFPRKSAGRKRKKNQDRCLMDREAGEDHNENEIILGSSKAAGTCKKRHVQSLNAKFMNEVGDRVFAELPAASRIQRVIRREKKLDNVKRKPNSIGHIHKDDSAKKQIKNMAQPDIIKETCTLSNKLFLEEPSEVLERSNSCSTSHKLKKIRRLASVVDQKNIDGDEYVLSTAAAQAEVFEDDGKSNKDHAGHSLEKEKIHRQKDMPALRKCDAVSIKCAFCHSTELTEVLLLLRRYTYTLQHNSYSKIFQLPILCMKFYCRILGRWFITLKVDQFQPTLKVLSSTHTRAALSGMFLETTKRMSIFCCVLSLS